MKKICLFLIAVMLLGQISVFADSDAPVVMTYTAAFSKEQGKNNWYFYEYGKTDEELGWDTASSRWKSKNKAYPLYSDGEMTPENTNAVGFRFVAPEKGMVRLRGSVTMPYADSSKGNGVKVSIVKGSTELWKSTIKYGAGTTYDLEASLRAGESLDFKIDANGNNGYDWTRWYPTVEYLGIAFLDDNADKHYQRKNGEKTEIPYNTAKEAFVADDGLAFMDDFNVMPTDEYSVIRSVEIKEDGRYRVLCKLKADDIRSNGVVVKIYKNEKMFWQQLCTDEGTSIVDVRAMCAVGDIIEVEVCVNEFGGYSNFEWSCEVEKYVGTLENISSTSVGANYHYTEKYTLGSLIGATQGSNGIRTYSIRKDVWHPMSYNASKSRWDSTVKIKGVTNVLGYVSQKAVHPGRDMDSVIEWTVPKSGTIKLSGNVYAPTSKDGVVVDIYKNNKLVWSNRVGGTRLVSWDEPFDVAYVQQEINAITNVNVGDKIVYIFDQWRNSSNDDVDISDFEIGYIEGDVLSDTTKWKIKNSVLVDTKTNQAMVNGEKVAVDTIFINGATYMDKNSASAIFSGITAETVMYNGKEYVSLRKVSDSMEKNILWAAGRLVIIHDGLPPFFGFAELGEIGASLEGGDLF